MKLTCTQENFKKAIYNTERVVGKQITLPILENILLEKFEKSKLKIVLVRGKRGNSLSHKNIQVIDFSEMDQLAELIVNAKTVICRSGYSTLMDLHVLGYKNLILIPTPGQTEQEYLAKKLKKEKVAYSVDQNKFDLKSALNESINYKGFDKLSLTNEILEKRIVSWLGEIKA